jgi:hypothetical protein
MMNGIGRRSVIVGVALAATMSAGVALAADTGLSRGVLKAVLTTPAVSQASLANPAQGAAFSSTTNNIRYYVLPAEARFASPDSNRAMSNLASSLRTSESLGAGGYASSLREAGYLGDSRNLSATRSAAQIDLSQLADDLTTGAEPDATALSSGGAETTIRYSPSPRLETESDIRLARRVEGGSVGLTVLADALTAGNGAGETAFAGRMENASLKTNLSRLGVILAGGDDAGQTSFSESAGASEMRSYRAPGRLIEENGAFANPVRGANYTASLSDAPRYESGS